jgi:endonuclease-3
LNVKDRSKRIFDLLKREYSHVKGTGLNFSNPLELLVASILSAQCTDEKVNEVSETLFKRYHTVDDYANSDLYELQQLIRPTGFYRNKAKFIKAMAIKLIEEYNSTIPQSMEEMTSLPGVARKTANIVLSNVFGLIEGIAVDTHVMRLSKRLELTHERYREKIEKDLMNLFPNDQWFDLSNLLIAHGRKVCQSRRPQCDICILNKLCPSAFKK